eukprot:TRINITY_DN18429_c0_g1_i1.p1 TRINITY_DN18429_c0_g1~~TRINITY_DN18429_c0_g1_i1.p1  ORF type:complete len:1089 (-),score=284.05 TRINITY_DN18429_c0_g1_i1:26-2908(-)
MAYPSGEGSKRAPASPAGSKDPWAAALSPASSWQCAPLSPTAFDLCRRSLPSLRRNAPASSSDRRNSRGELNRLLAGTQRALTVQQAASGFPAASQFETPMEEEGEAEKSAASCSAPGMELPAAERVEQLSGPHSRSGSKRESSKARLLHPASKSQMPELPSVQACLDRYHQELPITFLESELTCMKRFYNLRKEPSSDELEKEELPEVLTLLGYFLPHDPVGKEVLVSEQTVAEFSTVDFNDFSDLCARFISAERDVISRKVDAWLASRAQDATCTSREEALRQLLRSLGVVCTKASVAAVLEVAGLSDERFTCQSKEELLQFLAARRACEGFTSEELATFRAAFDDAADKVQLLAAGELSDVLLNLFGVYSAEYLREVMDRFGDTEARPAMGFYEFLVYARLLRELMVKELTEHFEKADSDGDGLLSAAELRTCLAELGFTLLDVEFKEQLNTVGIDPKSLLDVDTAWAILLQCQSCNGFVPEEVDALSANFNRFCDEDGEMLTVPVQELLRYMGHENSLEEVHQMLDRVDFNGNGSMDVQEFLRLMRIQKERDLALYRDAYKANSLHEDDDNTDDLDLRVQRALKACNLKLRTDLMDEVLESAQEEAEAATDQGGISFDCFVRVASRCREIIPDLSRKRAKFKEQDMKQLRAVFDERDTQGNGTISIGDFFWLMSATPLSPNTAAKRDKLLAGMEKARKAAIEVGIDESEVGEAGSPCFSFTPFLFFLRGHLQEHDERETKRLDKALLDTKFSTEEVAQFREVFSQLADEENSQAAQAPQTAKASTTGDGDQEVLSPPALQQLEDNSAAQLSPTHFAGQAAKFSMLRRRSVGAISAVASRALDGAGEAKAAEGLGQSQAAGKLAAMLQRLTRVPMADMQKVVSFLSKACFCNEHRKLLSGEAVKRKNKSGALDFPDFLCLMRLVLDLDSNIASIVITKPSTLKDAKERRREQRRQSV